jgi:hypothetical protein
LSREAFCTALCCRLLDALLTASATVVAIGLNHARDLQRGIEPSILDDRSLIDLADLIAGVVGD